MKYYNDTLSKHMYEHLPLSINNPYASAAMRNIHLKILINRYIINL